MLSDEPCTSDDSMSAAVVIAVELILPPPNCICFVAAVHFVEDITDPPWVQEGRLAVKSFLRGLPLLLPGGKALQLTPDCTPEYEAC